MIFISRFQTLGKGSLLGLFGQHYPPSAPNLFCRRFHFKQSFGKSKKGFPLKPNEVVHRFQIKK